MKVIWPCLTVSLLFGSFYCSYSKTKIGGKRQATHPICIGTSIHVQSAILGESRELNIYLPPDYSTNDTASYPVIFLLDGGLEEDFMHVCGLVQFNSQPWVARLQPSIVVGICNVDRKRDFTFPTTVASDQLKYPTTGGSAKFINFLTKELAQYIIEHFRTNGKTTIIGESLGGLLAAEILCDRPNSFDQYILISPSIWWNNGSILKKELNWSSLEKRIQVFIAAGKEGLAPSEEPHVMEVDANVLLEKIQELHNKYVTPYLDYLPGENHATIAHQALLDAFKTLPQLPGGR